MVDAEENPQLMIYGLGVLAIGEMLYSIDTVRMTIYQPRLEHISTWEISAQKAQAMGRRSSATARGNGSQRRRRFLPRRVVPLLHGQKHLSRQSTELSKVG